MIDRYHAKKSGALGSSEAFQAQTAIGIARAQFLLSRKSDTCVVDHRSVTAFAFCRMQRDNII